MEIEEYSIEETSRGEDLTPSQPDDRTLQKNITLLSAICLVFGSIIGSGIFVSVLSTLNIFTSQPLGIVLLLWGGVGIISIFGGLCYAELGTRIPECGGERAYYKKILNEHFSKTFVICNIFLIRPLTLATLAMIFGEYFVLIFTDNKSYKIYEQISAIVLLFLCTLTNSFSKFLTMKLGIIFTLLKIFAILIICGCGIQSLIQDSTSVWKGAFDVQGFEWNKFGQCLFDLFWAYESWNIPGYVAGDMKNPNRDIPLAVTLGVSAVVILYIFSVFSYVNALGFTAARMSNAIAYDLAKKKLKEEAFILLALICSSVWGAANGLTYATSQVSASAGLSGDLPLVFSMVEKKLKTPIVSLVVVFFISICFTFINVKKTLKYCEFLNWIFYFISFVCLWIIKIKEWNKPKQPGIFTCPFYLIIPIHLGSILFIVLSFAFHYLESLIFTSICLAIFASGYIPKKYTNINFLKRFQDNLISFLSKHMRLEVPS